MKIDGRVAINYGGFHTPFNDYDEFYFAVERGDIDRLRTGRVYGVGMQTFFERMSLERLVDVMRKADDEQEAQLRVETMITADEGFSISGDEIADMLEERKKTGVSLAKLAQKLKNVKMKTIIYPGPGVPEIAARRKNRHP